MIMVSPFGDKLKDKWGAFVLEPVFKKRAIKQGEKGTKYLGDIK